MTVGALLWFSVAALIVAGVAAMGVQSLRDFSRVQLKELLRSRGMQQRYEEILAALPRALHAAETMYIGAVVATIATAAAYFAAARRDPAAWELSLAVDVLGLLGAAIAVWLFAFSLPRTASRVWAESFIAHSWPLWKAAGQILYPWFVASDFIESIVRKLTGAEPRVLTEEELEDEIREMVTEGLREGLLEDDAREMIESVMALHEVNVSEIMTHRTDMVSIHSEMPWDDALRAVIASAHTRIPVYSKNRDNVIGVLHIKDMLEEMANADAPTRRSIVDLLRPPFFVPETKPVDDLLKEFQHSRNHMAIVLDEFGGVSGLVTIEDVLEEIVGEIADEHDEATADAIKPLGNDRCEASAGVHLSVLNERLGLNLPERPHVDTIGGFVFHQLGRIPHNGEELVWDGVRIKVLEANRRRISRVSIEVTRPTADVSTDHNP